MKFQGLHFARFFVFHDGTKNKKKELVDYEIIAHNHLVAK